MSNKQQTAVDWLLQQFDEEKTPIQWEEVYKKAKQLEKRQIQNAFNNGAKIPDKKQKIFQRWMDTNMSAERRNKLTAEIPKTGQKYYKETYGND